MKNMNILNETEYYNEIYNCLDCPHSPCGACPKGRMKDGFYKGSKLKWKIN